MTHRLLLRSAVVVFPLQWYRRYSFLHRLATPSQVMIIPVSAACLSWYMVQAPPCYKAPTPFHWSPRSPGHSKPNSCEDQYEALDKRNQVTQPAEDNEVFLTPKAGHEKPSTSTTEKQNKSVTFVVVVLLPGLIISLRLGLGRSLRNSIFVRAWTSIKHWVILAKGFLVVIVQTRRRRSGSHFQVNLGLLPRPRPPLDHPALRLLKGLAVQGPGRHGPLVLKRL